MAQLKKRPAEIQETISPKKCKLSNESTANSINTQAQIYNIVNGRFVRASSSKTSSLNKSITTVNYSSRQNNSAEFNSTRFPNLINIPLLEQQNISSTSKITSQSQSKIKNISSTSKITSQSQSKTTTKLSKNNLIYLVGEPKDEISTKSFNSMDLSESDLQVLLRNFYKLESGEQQMLIKHLRDLEFQKPELVNELKSFVRVTSPEVEKLECDLIDLDELDDILEEGCETEERETITTIKQTITTVQKTVTTIKIDHKQKENIKKPSAAIKILDTIDLTHSKANILQKDLLANNIDEGQKIKINLFAKLPETGKIAQNYPKKIRTGINAKEICIVDKNHLNFKAEAFEEPISSLDRKIVIEGKLKIDPQTIMAKIDKNIEEQDEKQSIQIQIVEEEFINANGDKFEPKTEFDKSLELIKNINPENKLNYSSNALNKDEIKDLPKENNITEVKIEGITEKTTNRNEVIQKQDIMNDSTKVISKLTNKKVIEEKLVEREPQTKNIESKDNIMHEISSDKNSEKKIITKLDTDAKSIDEIVEIWLESIAQNKKIDDKCSENEEICLKDNNSNVSEKITSENMIETKMDIDATNGSKTIDEIKSESIAQNDINVKIDDECSKSSDKVSKDHNNSIVSKENNSEYMTGTKLDINTKNSQEKLEIESKNIAQARIIGKIEDKCSENGEIHLENNNSNVDKAMNSVNLVETKLDIDTKNNIDIELKNVAQTKQKEEIGRKCSENEEISSKVNNSDVNEENNSEIMFEIKLDTTNNAETVGIESKNIAQIKINEEIGDKCSENEDITLEIINSNVDEVKNSGNIIEAQLDIDTKNNAEIECKNIAQLKKNAEISDKCSENEEILLKVNNSNVNEEKNGENIIETKLDIDTKNNAEIEFKNIAQIKTKEEIGDKCSENEEIPLEVNSYIVKEEKISENIETKLDIDKKNNAEIELKDVTQMKKNEEIGDKGSENGDIRLKDNNSNVNEDKEEETTKDESKIGSPPLPSLSPPVPYKKPNYFSRREKYQSEHSHYMRINETSNIPRKNFNSRFESPRHVTQNYRGKSYERGSFRSRGSGSFGSFRPRGSSSFRSRGSDCFRPRDSGNLRPRGSDCIRPRGSGNFRPRGSDGFRPRGSDSFRSRGSSNRTYWKNLKDFDQEKEIDKDKKYSNEVENEIEESKKQSTSDIESKTVEVTAIKNEANCKQLEVSSRLKKSKTVEENRTKMNNIMKEDIKLDVVPTAINKNPVNKQSVNIVQTEIGVKPVNKKPENSGNVSEKIVCSPKSATNYKNIPESLSYKSNSSESKPVLKKELEGLPNSEKTPVKFSVKEEIIEKHTVPAKASNKLTIIENVSEKISDIRKACEKFAGKENLFEKLGNIENASKNKASSEKASEQFVCNEKVFERLANIERTLEILANREKIGCLEKVEKTPHKIKDNKKTEKDENTKSFRMENTYKTKFPPVNRGNFMSKRPPLSKSKFWDRIRKVNRPKHQIFVNRYETDQPEKFDESFSNQSDQSPCAFNNFTSFDNEFADDVPQNDFHHQQNQNYDEPQNDFHHHQNRNYDGPQNEFCHQQNQNYDEPQNDFHHQQNQNYDGPQNDFHHQQNRNYDGPQNEFCHQQNLNYDGPQNEFCHQQNRNYDECAQNDYHHQQNRNYDKPRNNFYRRPNRFSRRGRRGSYFNRGPN